MGGKARQASIKEPRFQLSSVKESSFKVQEASRRLTADTEERNPYSFERRKRFAHFMINVKYIYLAGYKFSMLKARMALKALREDDQNLRR